MGRSYLLSLSWIRKCAIVWLVALCGTCGAGLLIPNALAELKTLKTLPAQARALTTAEIETNFANMRDDAAVQDEKATKAVNFWYADGRFENNWSRADANGRVMGRWWAENNQRCIIIAQGLPELEGQKRCAPVYQYRDVYLSVEADGRVHGVHRLSPISSD